MQWWSGRGDQRQQRRWFACNDSQQQWQQHSTRKDEDLQISPECGFVQHEKYCATESLSAIVVFRVAALVGGSLFNDEVFGVPMPKVGHVISENNILALDISSYWIIDS